MKLKLFLISTFSCVITLLPHFSVAASNDGYTFTITTPAIAEKNIQASDKNSYQKYSFEKIDRFTTEVGKPQLPILTQRIAVPADAKNITVEIIDSKSSRESISHPIYPVAKDVVKKDTAGNRYVDQEFFKDENFYKNSKGFYPAEKAKIVEHAEFRGLHYVTIETYPLRYDPSKKLLEKNESITIKVHYESDSRRINTERLGKDFKNFIKSSNIQNAGNDLSSVRYPELPQGSVNRPTNLLNATPTDYLIIAADDFYNSMNLDSLANYRASEAGGSYQVTIVRTSDIYSTAFPDKTGYETIDQLVKIFIKYAYTNYNGTNPPPSYVLLVGDTVTDANNQQVNASNYVPVHISTYQSYGEYAATDFWYSCLDGTFPSDYLSDTYDQIGDVAIGRFPIQNDDELSRMVNKTINFENVTNPGEWQSTVGLLDGFIDQLDNSARSSFANIQNNTLFLNALASVESYRSDLTNDYAGRETFRQVIKDSFNSGRLMTVVDTHGSKITWSDGTDFTNIFCAGNINCIHDDLTDLVNTDKLSILLTGSCDTGHFDDSFFPSLGELFVKSNNAGAVAYFGSSRITNVLSFTTIEDLIDQTFTYQQYILGNSALIALNTSFFSSSTPIRYCFNLLGDPALDINKVVDHVQAPELSATLNSFQATPDSITFHSTVKNLGSINTNNVTLTLYNGNPKSGGTPINVTILSIETLTADEQLAYDFTVPKWDPNYLGDVYLVVDKDNQILEVSEDNNTSNPLHLSFPPDLTCWISFYTVSGPNIIFHVTINNTGLNDALSVPLDLYDGNPSSGGTKIATITPVPFVEGTQQAAYDFTIPIWNTNYAGYVYLWADPNNQIPESSETNNISYGFYCQLGSSLTQEIYIGTGGHAKINNNKIAYDDYFSDVYMYDTNTKQTTTITPSGSVQVYPSISGDWIVYQDKRNVNYDIYAYNLTTHQETRITTNISNQTNPAISGSKIVWQDDRNGSSNYDIYAYDLNTQQETQITTNTSNQKIPAIAGNKVVWEDSRNGNADIYMYDFTTQTETQITTDPAGQMTPSINENKVVYRNLTATRGIYMYDLDLHQETQISSGGFNPNISGNLIVWDDGSSIYSYNLITHQSTTIATGGSFLERSKPSVYQKKIVYQALISGSFQVYMVDTNKNPLLNTISDQQTNIGTLLTFEVSANDQDNDLLTFSISNLSDATITNNPDGRSATVTWTPTEAGSYSAHITVDDGYGGTASQDVAITVNQPNRSPVLNPIGNKTGNEGQLLSFTVSASDPDNDTLVYSASNLPSGATFDPNTHIFTWTPNYTQSGTYPNVSFTITDGQILVGDAITITVNDVKKKHYPNFEQK